LLSISILSLAVVDVFQVMMCVMMAFRGLVLSHPVGSTSGRMIVLSGITNGLVWYCLCRLVFYFRCVSNSEPYTFMQKIWFVIMNLEGCYVIICDLFIYGLTFVWVLMYNCRSCDVSHLPGLTRQRWQVTSILLLNGQVEWFGQ
jgi:hypothetical protein